MNRRVLLGAALGRDPYAVVSPLVGQPAPDFTLPAVDGTTPVELAGLRGKPVVLNFWATWCVPCLEEHEVLAEAARTLGSDVAFVGVVYADEEAAVRRYLARHGQAYPAVLDDGGRAAIAYGVTGVPESFFIDAAGTIVAKTEGALDRGSLERYLEQARGGRS
jgi:cytochrome c biogenesis protein CcmG, thiol:disulfide interchange protein DsbE